MSESPGDEPSNLVGKTLAGRFKLLRIVGEGGMASVYAATVDGKPPEVAVKVMNAELAEDKTVLRRFAREAQAAFRLEHPTLVKVLHQGVDGEHAFIVMELVRGQNLHQILSVRKRLPQGRAARIVMQVCEGLAVAHEQGIIHRDLKPGNVMLVEGGDGKGGDRVKILDFGIAKMLDTVPQTPEAKASREQMKTVTQSVLTRVGTIVGTPAYMSPEQCMAKPLDGRSDLYTLGVLLFEMVTGELPFEGDSPLHVAMKHAHEPVPPPSKVYAKTHGRLEKVILRVLQKDPAARYENAPALRAALEEILPELDKEAAPAPAPRLGGGLKLERAKPVEVSKTAVSQAPEDADDAVSTGEIEVKTAPEVATPAPPDVVNRPPRPEAKTMMGVGTLGARAADARRPATTLASPGGARPPPGRPVPAAPVVLEAAPAPRPAAPAPRRTAWDDRPLPQRPDRPAPDSDDSDNVRTLAREGSTTSADAAPTPPKGLADITIEPPTPNAKLPFAPTAAAPPSVDALPGFPRGPYGGDPGPARPAAGAVPAPRQGPNQTLVPEPSFGAAVQPGVSLSQSGPHAPVSAPVAGSAPGGAMRGTLPMRAWLEGGAAPGGNAPQPAAAAPWPGGGSTGAHAPIVAPPPPPPAPAAPTAAAIQTRSLVVGIIIGMLAVGVVALALAFLLR